MKIIKEGIDPKSRPIQTECRNCKAVLEEDEKALQWDHEQDGKSAAWAACPCCDQSVWFYRGEDL